jgi:hypothetical protein
MAIGHIPETLQAQAACMSGDHTNCNSVELSEEGPESARSGKSRTDLSQSGPSVVPAESRMADALRAIRHEIANLD